MQAPKELEAVAIVAEDVAAIDTANGYVMGYARSIETRRARHGPVLGTGCLEATDGSSDLQ
jgi:hypothetical protein